MRSRTGLVFALLYALAFAAAYADYLSKAGEWFSDGMLIVVALPFIATMAALFGGFAFSGDAPLRVLAALIFCCAGVYVIGAILGAVASRVAQLTKRPRPL